MASDPVSLGICRVVRITSSGKAVVLLREDLSEVCVPISVLELEESDIELEPHSSGEVFIAAWFAEKEGLE